MPTAATWRAFLRCLAGSLSLGALLWLGVYGGLNGLGLYEDDFLYSRLWHMPPATWWKEVRDNLQPGGILGRPLGTVLVLACSRLGNSVEGCYLVGFALQCLTVLAMWAVLRELFAPRAAWAGAAFFVLYPADTARFMLARSFHVYPALGLVLLAAWLFLKGWRKLSLLPYAASLLTYELGALPFLAVAWLQPLERRQRAAHVARALLVLGLITAWRLQINPGRLSEAQGWGAVGRAANACLLGPSTVLWCSLMRFWNGLHHPLWALLPLVLFGWFSQKSDRRPVSRTLLATALGMVVANYPLMVTVDRYPPVMEFGRLTSTHSGASLGAAILAAALFQRTGPVWLAIYLTCLGGLQVSQADGCRAAWTEQRQRWRQILELAPDLSPGTVVLVHPGEPVDARSEAFPWTMPIQLSQVLDLSYLPLESQPRVFFLADCQARGRVQAEGIAIEPVPWEPTCLLQSGNVIYLELDGQRWRRREGTVKILGRPLRLKAYQPSRPLQPGLLWRWLGPAAAGGDGPP